MVGFVGAVLLLAKKIKFFSENFLGKEIALYFCDKAIFC